MATKKFQPDLADSDSGSIQDIRGSKNNCRIFLTIPDIPSFPLNKKGRMRTELTNLHGYFEILARNIDHKQIKCFTQTDYYP